MVLNLMFMPVYINGVLANEKDRKRFLLDFKAGKINVRSARIDKINQIGFIHTF